MACVPTKSSCTCGTVSVSRPNYMPDISLNPLLVHARTGQAAASGSQQRQPLTRQGSDGQPDFVYSFTLQSLTSSRNSPTSSTSYEQSLHHESASQLHDGVTQMAAPVAPGHHGGEFPAQDPDIVLQSITKLGFRHMLGSGSAREPEAEYVVQWNKCMRDAVLGKQAGWPWTTTTLESLPVGVDLWCICIGTAERPGLEYCFLRSGSSASSDQQLDIAAFGECDDVDPAVLISCIIHGCSGKTCHKSVEARHDCAASHCEICFSAPLRASSTVFTITVTSQPRHPTLYLTRHARRQLSKAAHSHTAVQKRTAARA